MPKTDGTLNGPTTPAWLRPWRRYLAEHLRVEFVPGTLTRIDLQGGPLTPYVKRNGSDQEEPDVWIPVRHNGKYDLVDYYIVATDAVTAERLTEGLPEIGVVHGLRGFTTRIPPNPRGPEKEQPRTPGVLPGHVPWDRFQTLTGIQFFFPFSVRLAEGCLGFADTPWRLSALNSQQYWATPPTLARDGFAAMLSVNIGHWHVREPGVRRPSECSRHELAQEVWRQIKQATEQPSGGPSHGGALPEPAWYHVDRFIRFGPHPTTGKERPVENRAPRLIPILGDWERRPGPEPWDPLAPTPPGRPGTTLAAGLWQAPHGGYPVHWGRLVFAGTYLKTFSRTSSLESANESARHAVNAILDHYLAHYLPLDQERPHDAPGGQAVASGMTPIGEYCRIWDPEKQELPELAPLRELDARLFAAGLPHVWDVLQLEPLALPLLTTEPADDARALRSFVEAVRGPLEAMVNIV